MKTLGITLLLLTWFLPIGQADVHPLRTIAFETSVPAASEMAKELVTAFSTIFKKQGYDFVPLDFPSMRGLEELKKNRVDGTMGRFGNIEQNNGIKDFLRIDYPLVFLTFSMWCVKDLDKSKVPIKLGLRLGNTIMTQLNSISDKSRVTGVELNSYVNAIQMLKTGRLDCILGNPPLMISSQVDMKDLEIFTKHDLITAASYPWISSQYSALKPILEKELKAWPFPEPWRKKFRLTKSTCQNDFDVLCPDGIVFQRMVDFKRPIP